MSHSFAGPYTEENLSRIAYPLGGIGTGGMCLTGSGELEAVALRHKPALFNNPFQFASLYIAGPDSGARVLEGPVPSWRPAFPWGKHFNDSGSGCRGASFGFPHFSKAVFKDRFPAAEVALTDDHLPVEVTLTAWSPFIPGDADASSRPVIILEYELHNSGSRELDAVIGFHSRHHLMSSDKKEGASIEHRPDGVVFRQKSVERASEEAALRVACDAMDVKTDSGWFRGSWFDASTMLWRGISRGHHIERRHTDGHGVPDGASVTARLALAPGESQKVTFRLSWYVPFSDVEDSQKACCGEGEADCCAEPRYHRPRYAALHGNVDEVDAWLRDEFDHLRTRSFLFGDMLAQGDWAPEFREALVANLGILRSPTVLRQYDGRVWAWEGCHDDAGCCAGTCTHVWNWAQALAHLFPDLERGLRETEHGPGQMPDGGQRFRVPLPIQQVKNRWHVAVDGQLGGLIKAWRDWRISGDTEWLRRLWPSLKTSLEYIISTFDPDREGVLRGAQHNTYDIEFHGPNGMLMSCYLAALVAASDMAQSVSDTQVDYAQLADGCRGYLEDQLWDGRGFIQETEVREDRGEKAGLPNLEKDSPEVRDLYEKEGPRYQYGTGVLTTALLGEWMAAAAGLKTGLDAEKVQTFLASVRQFNLRRDLSVHANPQRCSYALGEEGGLLVCSWPDNDAPSLPFPYSEEIWTSLEYQTASHLIRFGRVEEAREIVALARSRYDGRVRNPFDEIECGHWYARALAGYDLLYACGGARYDAVTQTMHLAPAISGDFLLPFFAGDKWGQVGVRDGKPFYRDVAGTLEIQAWAYQPAGQSAL